ncbi:hypothetical protein FACS1894125_6830 [Actinomycetota bacterium]|nr:hypothetical protein FACS1894125_6830 [Actinomycetota bacterium]
MIERKVNEPLTGRKWTFKMFPLSFEEMVDHTNTFAEKDNLENRMLFGYYPDVVNNPGQEREILNEIVNENLYKDIYKWEEIRKPVQLENLARALAFQVGSQVKTTEIAQLVGLTNATTEKYIRLLEQSYVIFRLGSFSRNLRNELKASDKYYFYDNGIRNALIGDFTPVALRQDVGHLFENFIVAELAKKYMPSAVGYFAYFWRTKNQQEIDFILERDGKLKAYEFKWNPKTKAKLPKSFADAYPNAEFTVVSRDDFEKILLNEDES